MKWYSLTFLTLLVGLLAAGCSSSEEAAEQGPASEAVRVEVLELSPSEFKDVVELTGTVEALDDATLSAQASGTVEYIADLGTPVKKGAVVARLDDDEAQSAVAQSKASVETARSQLALAQDNYNRLQPLYKDSVISAQEFESTRSKLQQAKAGKAQAEAQLASAKKRLENTRIRAPFPGTVEEKHFELGEQVSPGQKVSRILDVTPAKITAGVPERYAGDIERGSSVTVRFDAYGNFSRTGRVSFVGSAVNTDSRTFPVEVNIENGDRRLKPEMVAQLLLTRATLDDALVVPRDAVIRDERGTSIYTAQPLAGRADTLGVAHSHNIAVGPTYGDQAVIESGLTAGDLVVVTGQNDVAPGDTVDIRRRYQRIPPSLDESTPPKES